MQIPTYAVIEFDNDEKAIRFFDGKEFQEDEKRLKFFPTWQLDSARIEQGNQQKFYPQNEVRVVKFQATNPDIFIANKEEQNGIPADTP